MQCRQQWINKKILQVKFPWVKYIVYFKDHGWYAGIPISKQGDWPRCVELSCAKTFA